MKTNKNEIFEIIRMERESDEQELLEIFETKEEALAYGEKLAENIKEGEVFACVSNHVIEKDRESCEIHEVWDTISDQIIKELEEEFAESDAQKES